MSTPEINKIRASFEQTQSVLWSRNPPTKDDTNRHIPDWSDFNAVVDPMLRELGGLGDASNPDLQRAVTIHRRQLRRLQSTISECFLCDPANAKPRRIDWRKRQATWLKIAERERRRKLARHAERLMFSQLNPVRVFQKDTV